MLMEMTLSMMMCIMVEMTVSKAMLINVQCNVNVKWGLFYLHGDVKRCSRDDNINGDMNGRGRNGKWG